MSENQNRENVSQEEVDHLYKSVINLLNINGEEDDEGNLQYFKSDTMYQEMVNATDIQVYTVFMYLTAIIISVGVKNDIIPVLGQCGEALYQHYKTSGTEGSFEEYVTNLAEEMKTNHLYVKKSEEQS